MQVDVCCHLYVHGDVSAFSLFLISCVVSTAAGLHALCQPMHGIHHGLAEGQIFDGSCYLYFRLIHSSSNFLKFLCIQVGG